MKSNNTILINKNENETLKILREYKSIVDSTNIISKTDPSGIITYTNKKFEELSGYSNEELIGHSHSIIKHPDNPPSLYKNLWNTLKKKKPWQGIIKNLRKNGSFYIVEANIFPILDDNNEIIEFIAIRHDITTLIEQQNTIKRQITDQLTQLPNREKLLEDIEKTKYPSIALINIDNFRDINDLYSFFTGDMILKQLSFFIQNHIKNTNYKLYKLPSDEYAILIDTTFDVYSFQDTIIQIAKNIQENAFCIELENSVHLRVTVGFSHGKENILSNADIALKDARKLKRLFLVYDEDRKSKEQTKKNLYWNKEIKSAIKDDRIVIFFQPIYNNKTKKIEKYESLVRLLDRDNEVISPYFFLNIAKKYRLYDDITLIVVKKSFSYFYDKPYQFSINLSIDDITNDDFVSFVIEEIKNFSEPERIIFEITETEGIENFAAVQIFLEDIKKLGCKVAIDDFGTGYSNFEYLLKLEIDYLKVDGSLVKNSTKDSTTKMVIETILIFCQKLGIKTITEFVSDKKIFDMVNKLGADYSQGYFIGMPQSTIQEIPLFEKM